MVCLGYGTTRTELIGHRVKIFAISVIYFIIAIIEGMVEHNSSPSSTIKYVIEFPVALY